MNSLRLLLGCCLGGWLACGMSQAQGERAPVEMSGWHRFEAGLDGVGGGEVSVSGGRVKFGVPLYLAEGGGGGLAVLSAGYEHAAWDFSGDFAPWREVDVLRLGVFLRYGADPWQLVAIPGLRWSSEEGAERERGRSESGVFFASYAVSDRLKLGPGLGVAWQLEDSASFFPVINFTWQIKEGLKLSTRPAPGANGGASLQLGWALGAERSLTFGARYSKQRFRLRDGVGETRSVPLFVTFADRLLFRWRWHVAVGLETAVRLRVEEVAGDSREVASDPAPFVGLGVSLRF